MSRPTYVLIHGGTSTGRFWDWLAPHLDAPALAVDLPGRGAHPADLATVTLEDHVYSVLDDIASTGADEVVLVAHSSGGLVVPGVVVGLGAHRVASIVLNSASVPPEGGCGLDCMKPKHRAGIEAVVAAGGIAGRLATPVPTRETIARSLADDLDDDRLDFASDSCRTVEDAFGPYFGEVRWTEAAAVPVTYVVNTLDRALTPDLQLEMAGRLPNFSRTVDLATGHLAPITRPAELAAIICTAVAPLP